jgi:large repetitive protein
MKPISVLRTIAFIAAFFTCSFSHAQNISVTASAVWMTDFSKDTVFNVTGTLGGATNIFTGNNFGVHVPNTHTLVFRGGQLTTHSTSLASDVCRARMYYRVYLQGGTPGVFSQIDFAFGEDCEFPPTFNSGGSCAAGDQKYDLYLPDGATDPSPPTDLTMLPVGNYTIEVYYEIDGLTDCAQTVVLNNGGSNYKASFSIQNPTLAGTNPTTCNGTDGFITINGLMPNATYMVSYTDDGNPVGATGLLTDALGKLIINGLNPGVYSGFKLVYSGTTINLTGTVTLSNTGVIPKFKKIDPFCAGTTAPVLPTISQNGITGTWNPAVVNNQNSGTYTFTPDAGQCASSVTTDVIVNQPTTPAFSFGTSLTLCPGATPPVLYKPSDNGITGTWNPTTVDNQNSGIYTFTPNPNQCANGTTFTVTVKASIIPTFSFGTSLSICAGGSVPALPTTSDNSINGTWSPSVIDNQNSGTYTFTPAAGQCATTATFNVTVNQPVTPVFSFGTSLSICAGGSVPALPVTSTNGINGTWSPTTIDNQASGVYTFTPSAGQCAAQATFTVTIGPANTPTFTFGTTLSICNGGSVPVLPTTSTNGITGAWSPVTIDNVNPGTYNFTPNAGQCATSTSLTVTVNPNITPTFSFGTSMTICAGSIVPSLPGTSDNGINGTWSPSTVSNQNSGTYTFIPSTGQCATSTSFTVTVNQMVIPTFSFGTTLSICPGGTVPTLVSTSLNGITGTWSPSTVDNLNSGTYTFTPAAGQCAATTTFTVTVNTVVTPVFSFGTSVSICAGASVPVLPTTSANGVNGTWSPSVVDNQNSGTYIFTPSAGQCANSTSFDVTVTPNSVPAFSFGNSLVICAGSVVPTLPSTSTNGITGTWSPSSVSNQTTGTYTFTPSAGQCATIVNFVVTVNALVTPTFSFGTSLTICTGANVPSLPTTSNNGISGSWSPSTVSNQSSGTYAFTPDAGQCASSVTLTVTVNPNIQPAFNFGSSLTICTGSSVPTLPTISANGISGTWSPSAISNQSSAVYTFTPNAGQCAVATTLNVTVNPKVTPTFSFATSLCAGTSVPVLPTTSSNGITGTWSPAIISNQTTGTYVFTPNAGQCANSTSFVITVRQNTVATFYFGTALTICNGGNVPTLPTVSYNGITGTWSPAVASNQTSGAYTFTPDAGQCASGTTFNVTVTPAPTVDNEADVTVYDAAVVPAHMLTGTPTGVNFSWTNSNNSIGLAASGTGSIPLFVATNTSGDPIKGTITVTPTYNGCTGTAKTYVITVMPLDKDIFIANVFTPNGDGRNDVLYVRGNYIKTMEMHIFNQYGRQVELITDPKKGWDGKYKGTPQPVGVYMYTLKVTMMNGSNIQRKGNVTLIR